MDGGPTTLEELLAQAREKVKSAWLSEPELGRDSPTMESFVRAEFADEAVGITQLFSWMRAPRNSSVPELAERRRGANAVVARGRQRAYETRGSSARPSRFLQWCCHAEYYGQLLDGYKGLKRVEETGLSQPDGPAEEAPPLGGDDAPILAAGGAPGACTGLFVVVAAAIMRMVNGTCLVLLAKRRPGKAYAGLWEFSGGKVKRGECVEQGLVRELEEELGIDVCPGHLEPIGFSTRMQDDGREMLMPLWGVVQFEGEPRGKEGQETEWVEAEELDFRAMPPADLPLVEPVQRAMRRLAARGEPAEGESEGAPSPAGTYAGPSPARCDLCGQWDLELRETHFGDMWCETCVDQQEPDRG